MFNLNFHSSIHCIFEQEKLPEKKLIMFHNSENLKLSRMLSDDNILEPSDVTCLNFYSSLALWLKSVLNLQLRVPEKNLCSWTYLKFLRKQKFQWNVIVWNWLQHSITSVFLPVGVSFQITNLIVVICCHNGPNGFIFSDCTVLLTSSRPILYLLRLSLVAFKTIE